MARFFIGLGLLFALLAVSIASCRAMVGAQEPIAQALDSAAHDALAGNMPQAAAYVERAAAAWKSARSFTASLADHQPLEDIECLLAQLGCNSDPAEYAALCADLSRRVRAVVEAQSLSLGAFF